MYSTVPRMFARRTHWNLAANRYSCALEEHRRAGREVLDLTASNPTVVGLRYREEALLNVLTHREAIIYEPQAKGLLLAREAVADYYAERDSHVSPDDLILTTSTSEGYSFVFRLLCDPGDAVLVPSPSYPLFDFLADLQDVKLIPYELVYDHGWQIDFHSLGLALDGASAQGVSCRAVLVVHPNNPTGSYVKPHEAEELSRICAANQMAIIADEVFLDYQLDDTVEPFSFSGSKDQLDPVWRRTHPVEPAGHGADRVEPAFRPASADPNHISGALAPAQSALTFTLSGLSKISALPQMKVAWIAVSGPEELKREALARLEVIADTYLSMNAPVQWAVPAMLEERRNVQPQMLARIRQNLAELDSQLARQTLCRRLAIEGGWYAVLRIPVTGSDEAFAIELLKKTGVLVHPGHFYDFAGEGFIIVSLITPREEFAIAIQRFIRFVNGM